MKIQNVASLRGIISYKHTKFCIILYKHAKPCIILHKNKKCGILLYKKPHTIKPCTEAQIQNMVSFRRNIQNSVSMCAKIQNVVSFCFCTIKRRSCYSAKIAFDCPFIKQSL